MSRGYGLQRIDNVRSRFRRTARFQTDMQQKMFARRDEAVALAHLVPEMHLFPLPLQDLGPDLDQGAREDFVDMADMGLGGEIAAPGCDILCVAADQLHHPVGRVTKGLQILRLVHVTVIVCPVERNGAPDGEDRLTDILEIIRPRSKDGARAQGALLRVQHLARAPFLHLQRAHHRNKVLIPLRQHLIDTHVTRLGVGLSGDEVDKLIVELGHVHQLGPRPFERRAELRHEMPHARLAPGGAVGVEQAHLRPSNAKPHADCFIDLLGGGDAVLHQPQRLAPDRFEEAIGHMCVDFLFQMQGEHAEAAQDLLRAGYGRLITTGCHQFDQRQEVNGVERVRDHDPPGPLCALLQLAGPEARRGGTDNGIRCAIRFDRRDGFTLQIQPLGCAFLNPHRILNRLGY